MVCSFGRSSAVIRRARIPRLLYPHQRRPAVTGVAACLLGRSAEGWGLRVLAIRPEGGRLRIQARRLRPAFRSPGIVLVCSGYALNRVPRCGSDSLWSALSSRQCPKAGPRCPPLLGFWSLTLYRAGSKRFARFRYPAGQSGWRHSRAIWPTASLSFKACLELSYIVS